MLTRLDVVGYIVTVIDDGEEVTARLGSTSCRVDRDSYLDAFNWGDKCDGILAEMALDALLAAGILICDETGAILTEDDILDRKWATDNEDAERRAHRKACL